MLTQNPITAVIAWAALSANAIAQTQEGQPGDVHKHADSAGAEAPASQQKLDAEQTPVGPHGIPLRSVGALQVETVVEPGGLRIFAYDQAGQPVELNRARGLVTLQIEGDPKRYRYDLFPEIGKDRSAASLAVAVDLSQIAGRQVELGWQLMGVAGVDRRPLKFTSAQTVPLTKAQRVAAEIESQGVCPVSGERLGTMGQPIAVAIGDQTIYVCCAGCIEAVKENPAKYLSTKPTLTVRESNEADAAAIALQKLCPVMDEPLGSMGAPLKVTGLGRDVFLCCKGCLKFLEKEPQKYLAKLPALPGPKVVKATEVDARFVAAQKLCPVMDEPLNAMGGPYKTAVEGRVIYLCCPGCAKKLHASPEVYLEKLASQGVAPPAVR